MCNSLFYLIVKAVDYILSWFEWGESFVTYNSPMYRSLDPEAILHQTEQLHQRVSERFPGRGLANVSSEVTEVAREARERAAEIASPNWWLRIGVGMLILVVVLILLSAVRIIQFNFDQIFDLAEFLAILDAGFNDIFLVGAALYFLIRLEVRYKRNRALDALHELRSLAHVIDMHQLTKDPERLLRTDWESTPSSPQPTMSAFLLTRYLDYCSEMLSILGKVAALYVQDFDDEVALAAVNEIEALTTGLSRKIWQKIMILREAQMGTPDFTDIPDPA